MICQIGGKIMNYTENFNPGMYDGDIDINITNKNYN